MLNKKFFAALLLAAASALPLSAAEQPEKTMSEITLPPPVKTGGMPLMDALTQRRTVREFNPGALPDQVLSDLLYAAFGISEPGGKRTVPTAMNRQDMVLYVLLKNGAYLYLPEKNVLKKVADANLRQYATARPGMGENGSVSIVIAGDSGKWAASPESGVRYMPMHAGAIMQNLYLFCTSRKLATVVCGSFVDGPLRKGLNLPPQQKIYLVQIVGTPVPAE